MSDSKESQRSWFKRSVMTLVTLAIMTSGLLFVSAGASQASVTYCGSGRCTVYLSQSETQALAQGRIPGAASVPPGPLKTAYIAMVYGHRWFAGQYANRGWCSAFTVDVRPWARQGYYGYACNWR